MARPLVAAMLVVFASSAAAAEGGFYIGAGYGEAHVEDHPASPGGGTVNFDAPGRSYRAFIGYRTRAAQHLDLAGEATYIDYGRAAQTEQGVSLAYKLRGGELSGLAILPLGLIDLYGKAGVVSWSSSREIGGATSSRSGTNGLYGFGVGFRADKLAVRAEYDYYDVSVVDRLKTFTLNFTFRFY